MVRKPQQLGTPATFPCTPHGQPGRSEPQAQQVTPRDWASHLNGAPPFLRPGASDPNQPGRCHGKVMKGLVAPLEYWKVWVNEPWDFFGGTIWRKTWPHARLEPRRNGWKPTKNSENCWEKNSSDLLSGPHLNQKKRDRFAGLKTYVINIDIPYQL